MNRRQAKKREKKQALKYLEYLDRYFDENEKWCILNNCPYYDHSGRYGGGCADQFAPKGFICENPYDKALEKDLEIKEISKNLIQEKIKENEQHQIELLSDMMRMKALNVYEQYMKGEHDERYL